MDPSQQFIYTKHPELKAAIDQLYMSSVFGSDGEFRLRAHKQHPTDKPSDGDLDQYSSNLPCDGSISTTYAVMGIGHDMLPMNGHIPVPCAAGQEALLKDISPSLTVSLFSQKVDCSRSYVENEDSQMFTIVVDSRGRVEANSAPLDVDLVPDLEGERAITLSVQLDGSVVVQNGIFRRPSNVDRVCFRLASQIKKKDGDVVSLRIRMVRHPVLLGWTLGIGE